MKLYSFLYMLFHEPLLVLTMLQSGAKWHKWPRWKFLYCKSMKIDSGIILEIGGGLSTLLLSRVAKKTNNRIRVVEKSEFWRQFIQSRLILPNVMFMNDPDFLNVDLIFIDTDFTISNPSFYQIIVDNREALCNKMGIPFYRKLKIGHNLG